MTIDPRNPMRKRPSLLLTGVIVLFVAILIVAIWRAERDANRPEAVDVTKTAEYQKMEKKLAVQTDRAAAAEADLGTLLKAVQEPGGVPQSRQPKRDTGSALAELNLLLNRAEQMVQSGNFGEALAIYVRAYNEIGWAGQSNLSRVAVLGKLRRLAASYPPAQTALGELRDSALQKLQTAGTDRKATMDVVMLNQTIGDNNNTVQLFNSLPADDQRRQSIATLASDALVEAKLYSEVAAVRSFGAMLDSFETDLRFLNRPGNTVDGRAREQVLTKVVRDIEVLAGSGKDEEVRQLTQKVLAFDHSQATQNLVRQHILRATGGG